MSERKYPTSQDSNVHGLSETEQLLVAGARDGGVVNLDGGRVRGSVLRDLLLEPRDGHDGAGSGLRVSNVVISGGVDLEGCTVTRSLTLSNARIENSEGGRGAIILRDARIKRFAVHSSMISGAIVADRVRVDNGVFLGGGVVRGPIQVRGADVGGAFAIEGTQFGDGKCGLMGAGLRLNGPLILRRTKVSGEVLIPRAQLEAGVYAEEVNIAAEGLAWGLNATGACVGGDFLLEGAHIAGVLGLENARIAGKLSLDGAKLQSDGEVTVAARGVSIDQGISARGAVTKGTMELQSGEIGKGFFAKGLELDGGETAIVADGIRVGGNWDLSGSKIIGQLVLPGAHIAGQLKLTEARLFGSDLAVRADGAKIGGGCYLSRAMVIGSLRFPAAVIGNQFRLRGASLKVDEGAALLASGSRFARDVELNGGLVSAGALVFDQAEIRGTLDLSDSRVSSAALAGAGNGVLARGASLQAGDAGAADVRVDETAISLVDARITRVLMPSQADQRPRGIVVLSRAQVGTYQDYGAAWPPAFDERERTPDGRDIDHLVLDGFNYDHLSNPSGAKAAFGVHSRADDRVGARRMMWLAAQEACDIRDHFKPQPWVQLGERLAAQGYHEDARNISIARRRLELSSHSTSIGQRWQGRMLDVFALYGHNPWRTIMWMAVFVLLFAGVWSLAAEQCTVRDCKDENVFVVTNRDAYTPDRFAHAYPGFHSLGYSFDMFVPFVSFGYADHWRPNIGWGPVGTVGLPSFVVGSEEVETVSDEGSEEFMITMGGVLYVLGVVEALLGLMLTSLAITGFTGLLRSD